MSSELCLSMRSVTPNPHQGGRHVFRTKSERYHQVLAVMLQSSNRDVLMF